MAREVIKIDFEFENTSGGYDVVPVTIRKMRFEAFHEVMAIVNDIYSLLQEDPNLKALFTEIFEGPEPIDPDVWANFSEEEQKELAGQRQKAAERRFFQGLMGAFPLLTMHLPKQATALLVVMTDIEEKDLKQQDLDVVLDVYDAMIKVNKIESLIERIKKSRDVTKQAISFLNLRRKSTAE